MTLSEAAKEKYKGLEWTPSMHMSAAHGHSHSMYCQQLGAHRHVYTPVLNYDPELGEDMDPPWKEFGKPQVTFSLDTDVAQALGRDRDDTAMDVEEFIELLNSLELPIREVAQP